MNSDFGNLPEDLKKKLRECKTEDELKGVLLDAGIELDADRLSAVSGGMDASISMSPSSCPKDAGATHCRPSYSHPTCPTNRV